MWIILEKWGSVIPLLNEICWVVFSDKRKVSQNFTKAQATKNIIYYFHQEQCNTPFLIPFGKLKSLWQLLKKDQVSG